MAERTTAGGLTIGEAARRSGITSKAIRFYESKGLLDAAPRTESGYRSYSDRDVEILRFIRQAKALDLSLREIGELIDLQRQGAQPCGKVLQIVDAHIDEIDRIMAELRSLRRTLTSVRREATAGRKSGSSAVVCRIIESGVEELA